MFQDGAGREVLGFHVLSNELGATLGPLGSFGESHYYKCTYCVYV